MGSNCAPQARFFCTFLVKVFFGPFFMVNQALSFEYGFLPTSGRNVRKTDRRWGKGHPPAQRMQAYRACKSPEERAIDSAVVYARKCLARYPLSKRGAGKSKIFKVGQQVWYLPIGKSKPKYRGKVFKLWKPTLPSKYGEAFVIIQRWKGPARRWQTFHFCCPSF